MNHRPLGYEPNELPGCSTPRQDESSLEEGRLRCQPLVTPRTYVMGRTKGGQGMWDKCETGEQHHPGLNLSPPVRVQCVEGATLR